MSDVAVLAIRSAVQAATAPDAQVGQPADLEAIAWLGSLLGYRWPESYLSTIAKHDGAFTGGALIYSVSQSIEIMLVFREAFRSKGYWPVGGDGCGNYYALDTHAFTANECPVVFLESNYDYQPVAQRYNTYSEFVVAAVAQ